MMLRLAFTASIQLNVHLPAVIPDSHYFIHISSAQPASTGSGKTQLIQAGQSEREARVESL